MLDLTSLGLAPVAPPDLSSTNPADKTPAYIRQWGLWHLSAYQRSDSRDFYRGHTSGRYALIDRYLAGDHQPTDVFRKENGEVDQERTSKVDFRPLACLKRPMRSLEGLLNEYQWAPTVTVLDDEAVADKDQYKGQAQAAMEVGPRMDQRGLPGLPLPEGMAQPPIDTDDLDLHMEGEYQHPDARAMELKLVKGLDMADWPDAQAKVVRDWRDYGVGLLHMDLVAGRRVPRHVRPHDAFILPTQTENFAGLTGGAHLESVPLARLLAELEADPNVQLTADHRAQLKSAAEATITNAGRAGLTAYDEQRARELAGTVPVIRFSFITTDVVPDTQGGEQPAQYAYEGTLVPGLADSDGQWLAYNCRKAFSQLRDEDNPLRALPLYVVYAPGIIGGKTKSLVEDCMPAYDGYNREYIKMQATSAKFPQFWLQFNWAAMREGITEKDAQKADASAQDVVKTFLKEGWIAGSGFFTDDEGNQVPADPITPQIMDLSGIIAQHWNSMQNFLRQIEDLTGINQSVAAGNAKQDVAAKSQEIAIQGAVNALDFLSRAKQWCFLRVCRCMAIGIQEAERPAGPGEAPRTPVTGEVAVPGGSVELLRPRPTLALTPGGNVRRVYVLIERLPLQQETEQFNAELAKYTQAAPGQDAALNPADIAAIQNCRTLKQKWQQLAVRVKRNRQAAMEADQQRVQMNSQQQQESAQVTGQIEAENAARLHEYKMAEIKAQGDENLRAIQAQAAINADTIDKQIAAKLQEAMLKTRHAADALLESQEHEKQMQERGHEHALAEIKAAPKPRPATK